MSSRVFQSIILQMKEATDRVVGIIDNTGAIIACSDLTIIGKKREAAAAEINSAGESPVRFESFTYKILSTFGSRFDFAAFVEGDDDAARSLCVMAAVALNGGKQFYDEKHDKATFIKNVILDNILPGDIYIRSRELHFPSDVPYAVLLIRQEDKADLAAVDVVQNMFPDRQHEFVISISETDIAVVREAKKGTETREIQQMAKQIEEALNTELYIKTVIGIGTVASNLRDLAGAFKEAQVAIEIGKVFDTEKTIITYENLGIGRLIYQLPTTLCEMFLSEVFKKNSIDSLDSETIFTINKFFENNLNVSETSRKLFVHRNTLVYRLEKIKKLTGLDLREFDHAIIFKVALMVRKYLASREAAY
ncbi:helix-turn-helix domain-containing protein [Oscillospiraceae bacterium OttesenSCG-928-F05]|nr:helix-turn-helix domain-containing protein [Oscillospiraceae bacterium OttesenSCG-928-F05]